MGMFSKPTGEPDVPSGIQPKSIPKISVDENGYIKRLPTSQSVNSARRYTSSSISKLPTDKTPTTVDVVKDYDWTYSRNKILKLEEIPSIYVKEFKMIGNSYLSSLMTSALLYPDAIANVAESATIFKEKLEATFKDNKFGQFMNNAGNKVSGVTSNITDKIKKQTEKYTNWAQEQISSMDKTADAWANKDLKDKYSYLYLRKGTGTSYIFPYFENEFISINNSFNDTYNSSDTILQERLKGLNEVMEKAAIQYGNISSITEPGMYIQRPQFYQFRDDGYNVKTSFFLYNTLPNDDSGELPYVKNLKLITKLIIQNTPHRHNRILVDPPCIYELTVPGRGFYPYAYISSLNVKHIGTKRMIPSTTSKYGRIIVPDAFEVEITFKSLTMDVNNFIIPEMGDAGIDVSKRFGIGTLMNDDKRPKISSEPKKQPASNIPINTPLAGIPNQPYKSPIASTQSYNPNIRTGV